jgi:hypothetical protein
MANFDLEHTRPDLSVPDKIALQNLLSSVVGPLFFNEILLCATFMDSNNLYILC